MQNSSNVSVYLKAMKPSQPNVNDAFMADAVEFPLETTRLLRHSHTLRNVCEDVGVENIGVLEVPVATQSALDLLREFLMLLNTPENDALDGDDDELPLDYEHRAESESLDNWQWRRRARAFPKWRLDFCRSYFCTNAHELLETIGGGSDKTIQPRCSSDQLSLLHDFLSLCNFLDCRRALRTVFRWLARDVIAPSSVADLRAFFKVPSDGGFTKEEYV
jgi:hypothetical protein